MESADKSAENESIKKLQQPLSSISKPINQQTIA